MTSNSIEVNSSEPKSTRQDQAELLPLQLPNIKSSKKRKQTHRNNTGQLNKSLGILIIEHHSIIFLLPRLFLQVQVAEGPAWKETHLCSVETVLLLLSLSCSFVVVVVAVLWE